MQGLSRYLPFLITLCLAFYTSSLAAFSSVSILWCLIPNGLFLVGLYDLIQRRKAVLKNYPITGHFRYLLEAIRPEVRQYFIEGDHDRLPFSRSQRAMVYRRARNIRAEKSFGTLDDVYQTNHEFLSHSMEPVHVNPKDLRITIGGPDCKQPYSASILNISAMSFGALSANAVRALSKGSAMGMFAMDTGEGGISRYHLEVDNDLIYEIGSGYFGCRTEDGKFDPLRFADVAGKSTVKMVEIKLSQGAKPGKGGILPGQKVNEEIAVARGVPVGKDCISPARHTAFDGPIGLMEFVAQLRELSGGKPVGFKLCIGRPIEAASLVKAMLKTGILPDFIVIDGSEGGTGAAPEEFTDNIGMPMRDGLILMHNILVGAGLRNKIKIGCSGKIISGFDIVRALALGADWVNSARGFMFALGCIQSQSCGSNQCPTGIATQDPVRQRALDVEDKAEKVKNFHANTLVSVADILGAAGIASPDLLSPSLINKRISDHELITLSQAHFWLTQGELLSEHCRPSYYKEIWSSASADSFTGNQIIAMSKAS
jgi:glutamate synthase domain-containing protein 2